jgi:hypothetical protein
MAEYAGNLAFLSNSFSAGAYLDGVRYPTVAHAYQAAKTEDTETRELVRSLVTPREAYAAGRKLEIRHDWNDVKERVMLELLRSKFENPILATMLADIDEVEIGDGWLATLLKRVRIEVVGRLADDDALCTP